MKHRGLTGLVASSVGLLLLLGFACVDADIPNISNDLRDQLEETFANAGAPPVGNAGDGGSASTPNAGAGGDGGAAGSGDASDPGGNGGAAGSSMAGIAGSDGEGAAGGPPETGDGCDGFDILATSCGTAGCHGENGLAGDFAASEEAAREFIGREGTAACADQGLVIDTDDPGASLLVTKLGDQPCGSRMPLTGAALSDEDIACVEEWIRAGSEQLCVESSHEVTAAA